MTISHAGYERAECDSFGDAGEIAERCVGLVHVQVRVPDLRKLKEVIHDPKGIEPRVLGGASDVGQNLSLIPRRAGPAKPWELKSELERVRYHATPVALARNFIKGFMLLQLLINSAKNFGEQTSFY